MLVALQRNFSAAAEEKLSVREGYSVLWYKLKTWYGGEEALVKEIRRTVPPYMYEDVFVIYNERNLRRQQRSIIEQEILFDGCVFLTCKETEPLFRRLEKIPAVSRLIATGYLSMFPLMEKDARFLEAISGTDHIVRASYVLRESEDSYLYRVYGPLEYLADSIEKIRFSSRCAKTRRRLWGEDTVIPLGILAKEDVAQPVLYHGREMMLEPPGVSDAGHYMLLEIGKDAEGKNTYRCRESVTILPRGETMSAASGHAGVESVDAGSGKVPVAV